MRSREDTMATLLHHAQPHMESKCCHYDWCVERRGVVTEDEHKGFHEIEDGMHPGCAPLRYWLDEYDALF